MSITHLHPIVIKIGKVKTLREGINLLIGMWGNNDKRVLGEKSKNDECFECYRYGHRAFNRLRQKSQPS